jgi:Na+/H+ antiporter NhaD/arsenite permease-like protein
MFLLLVLFLVLERKAISPAIRGTIDEASRKHRIRSMRFNQGWIAVLAFGLIFGLWHIPSGTPLWVVPVAVAINLFLMGVKIWQVRQTKKFLKQGSN